MGKYNSLTTVCDIFSYLFRPSLQQAEYFRNNHKRNIKERKTKQLPCSHGNAWEEFKWAPLLMCLSLDGEQRSGISSSLWSVWGLLADKLMPLTLEALCFSLGRASGTEMSSGTTCWSALFSSLLGWSSPSLVDPGTGQHKDPSDLFPSQQWPHGNICPAVSLLPPGWERDEEIG